MKFIKRISKNKLGQKFLGFLVFIVTNFTYKSISWKELKKPNSYYYKNSFEFNSYKKLSDNFIGSFKLQAGNINGYNGKYSPLSSNFKLS